MPSAGFVRVCALGDVREGEAIAISIDDADDSARVLVREGAEVFAVGRICPHRGGDLSEGVTSDGVLWCPVHSSGFDLRTGAALHPPASSPLLVYAVQVHDGDVYVSLRREP